MITIDVTENGHIRIDVPHQDATRLGAESRALANRVSERLAYAITGHSHFRLLSFRRKRGVANSGWIVNFIDPDRQTAYRRANGYEEEVNP